MSIQHSQPSTSGDKRVLTVAPQDVGQRLDRYLTSILSGLSRTSVQQLITGGSALVNGLHSKPGYTLREGDEIQLSSLTPAIDTGQAHPTAMPLDIVYEDDDLLVVNKAAGMVVHPAPGHHDDTLVNALLAYLPALRKSGDNLRPGIIHRLDKDTSGLIIVAKNTHAQAALVEQMARHAIVKRYLALVEGNVALDKGSIDAPIGRDPRRRQQMAITAVGSREARTYFRVLERFARHTLLLLQLETGRTHQIRLHLKAIGHPVVGDPVYGSGSTFKRAPLKRQFLHANQLRFTHPLTGATLELEASLPADLQAVLDEKDFL
ncbi:MAG: RluA family pseudouridine synthase [Ktedonobacteraceae bacterium]